MENNEENLLVSVEAIQTLAARGELENVSDGGGTGKTDTNDVRTVDIRG